MKKDDNHIEFLKELPKQQPFKVPEAYFETFEERLQQRIQQQAGKSKPKIIQMLRPVLWLAAGFVLVFLLVHYPLKMFFPGSSSDLGLAETVTSISNEWLYDDNLYNMISEDMSADTIDNEVVVDFLSAELSEYEIYSEMYN
ncbi:MAG TPA: hypothetical protein DIW50_14865 [Prolixibacteraceae bacterium]|nr:hypothetical protein [Prolixibacteraceae bacterium]